MDRKEVYTQIKKLGLEGKVKNKFGKNFTQVSTADLEAMINTKNKKAAIKDTSKNVNAKKDVINFRNKLEGIDVCTNNWKEKYDKAINVIAKFLAFMPEEILNDAAQAAKIPTPETVVEEVNFSQDDLDKMFKK